jgi:hypothetical protein
MSRRACTGTRTPTTPLRGTSTRRGTRPRRAALPSVRHVCRKDTVNGLDCAGTLFSSRPLTLAEVHAALAHHYDHPEELEGYLQRSEQLERQLETAKAEYLRRWAER